MRYLKIIFSIVLFLIYSLGGAFYMGKAGAYLGTVPFFANHEWYAVTTLVLATYLFWVSLLTLIHLLLVVWLKEPTNYPDYKAVKFVTGYYFTQDCKALIKATAGWIFSQIKEQIRLFK